MEPKLKLPKFSGKGGVEPYLEWEMKLDQIFMHNHIEEERKVALAALEFENYAMMWWHQVCREIDFGNRPHILTWEAMKRAMREIHPTNL